MSKVNVSKIVSEIQGLYAKDKKSQDIICLGSSVRTVYTEKDVIPLAAGSPLRELVGLIGLPYNKIAQCAGKADSGKSTIAGEVMAAAQKAGVQVILFDSEQKFDSNRFETHFGGKAADLLMIKTNEILKGGELVRKYITAVKTQVPTAKILFVWDSIGGSQSRSHAERALDDEKHSAPATDARENGAVMKMLVGLINKYPDSIAVYMANQTYARIGFMAHGDAISGGSKVEYHSSLIVTLKRIKVLTKQIKGVKTKTGIITRATVVKNHLSQSENSVHQMDFEITAKGCIKTEECADVEESD
jgi:RecA/RadA recombinase